MRLLFFILTLAAWANSASAQNINEEDKASITQKFSKFIPKKYVILDTANSGPDAAGVNNIALLLEEENNQDKSRLLLLLKDSNGRYELSVKCNNAVLCRSCGGVFGDPYAGMQFKKNILTINHYGGSAWRWTSDFTFRYQHNRWELIGISNDYFFSPGECNGEAGLAGRHLKEVNFSTGKMHIIESEDTSCTPKVDKWVKVKPFKKITLDEFDADIDYIATLKIQ